MNQPTLQFNTIRRSEYKRSILYVEVERPINKGFSAANVADDMVWRRTHTQPYTNAEIAAALNKQFPFLSNGDIKVSYSRYAGCRMCPCSPGYIIKNGNDHLEIWATVDSK